MKKFILIAIISSLNLIISFGQSFPGNSPEMLINKTVKPKDVEESLQEYFYKNFYIEFDKEKKQFAKDEWDNTPFPTKERSTTSKYSQLVGKEFNVIAVYEIIPKNSYDDEKTYALELKNEEIGTLFYKYDPSYIFNYELEVIGGLDYPKGFFCDDIDYEKDKFEKIERFYTPRKDGINFLKTIENEKTSIYMTVRTHGAGLTVEGKGLYLLFEDGTKISKPNEIIDVDIAINGYVYEAFFVLTKNDIKLLTEKTMTDKRLVVYDGTVDKDSAAILKEYLKCLVK